MYDKFIHKIESFIPVDINLNVERNKYMQSNRQNLVPFDNLCQNLAMFLSGFFSTHIKLIENYIKTNTD